MAQASVGHHCPECVAGHSQTVYTAQTLTNRPSPVTVALIAANVLAFVAQLVAPRDVTLWGVDDQVSIWGTLFGPWVEQGEAWRILTSGFLHGGLIHIGFNMYALWIFGPNLERALGPLRYGIVYLSGLLGGSLAVLMFNFNQPTLGASGAVLGLAGGLAGVLSTRGVNIFKTSLGTIFLINLGLPLLVPRISFWGHLGGIAAGFLAALVLTWLPERAKQSQATAVAAAVALLVALAAASLVAGGVL